MRSNVKHQSAARTHEGAVSVDVTPAKELRRAVMAHLLFEDSFYESGVDAATRIAELVKRVSVDDAAQAAIDAREKFKLRHVPLFIVREVIRSHRGAGRKIGDLIARVIQRPDECGELLALYRKDGKGEPYQLKIGLARALKKFSEYQLAKWDPSGGPGVIRLRDVLFLCHARSRTKEQGRLLARLGNKTYFPAATKSSGFRVLDEYELREERPGLETPDTWETQLSAGKDKKQTFERLMAENKLGALALLRNLRGMIDAGVNEDAIREALGKMNAERVLPFRFITAAKYAPRLEDALEAAMFRCLAEAPKLGGRTALLIDHSHSMDQRVSAKSEISRFDAAAALAMILRETTDRCRVFTFSDHCVEITPRRGFAMVQAVRQVRNPVGTLLGRAVRYVYEQFPECDRIIVLTDEQSADRPPHPQGHGYIINVAGYANGIAYGPWVSIDGWSEAVISYIQEFESDDAAR